ncbi:hypothetical protein [Streptomyces sp. B6B3]|uniref:hypothetical protein n=1 Tax=Streptomyces sp. B6B3 TaxID=3153570 RepID=UPI00325D74DD
MESTDRPDGNTAAGAPFEARNDFSGSTHGPVFQAGQFNGPITLNLYHGNSSAPSLNSGADLGEGGENKPVPKVPRTQDQLDRLLVEKPIVWEYLAWAGFLKIGMDKLNPVWLDHAVGNPGAGQYLANAQEVVAYADSVIGSASEIGERINYWLSEDMQRSAFGPPGEPGDPVVIEHVAKRLLDIYQGFMRCAVDLRSARAPSHLLKFLQLTAVLMNNPVREFREFVETLVSNFDRFSQVDMYDPDLRIDLTLHFKLTIDDDAMAAFDAEVERIERAGFR